MWKSQNCFNPPPCSPPSSAPSSLVPSSVPSVVKTIRRRKQTSRAALPLTASRQNGSPPIAPAPHPSPPSPAVPCIRTPACPPTSPNPSRNRLTLSKSSANTSASVRLAHKTTAASAPSTKKKPPPSPSTPDASSIHCFGCGQSGDVFSFVQKIENVPFPEAVRTVAHKCRHPSPSARIHLARRSCRAPPARQAPRTPRSRHRLV